MNMRVWVALCVLGSLLAVGIGPGRAQTPPEGRIAFVASRQTPQIYIMDADGANVRQLTDMRGSKHYLRWSPDGARLAFMVDSDLYVMDADGGNLTVYEEVRVGSGLSWAPDAASIVVGTNAGLVRLDLATRTVTPLTDNGQDGAPDWSPATGQILFLRGYVLYVMDASGDNIEQWTDSFERLASPCWSPDGSQIAFKKGKEIWLMDAASREARAIHVATDGIEYLTWSPDGQHIAFSIQWTLRFGGQRAAVYRIDLSDPETRIDVTKHEEVYAYAPAWQAQGTLQPVPASSSAPVEPQQVELSHVLGDAPQLGATSHVEAIGRGIEIPMSPDGYWFWIQLDEAVRPRFHLRQDSALATVRIVLEVYDYMGDSGEALRRAREQCDMMTECSVTLEPGKLDPGAYFLKVFVTPPGMWDTDVTGYAGWLTWDYEADTMADAVAWFGVPTFGYIDAGQSSQWYSIHASEGQDVTLQLWSASGADLDLHVMSGGKLLATGVSYDNPEILSFRTTGDVLYIEVANPNGQNTAYSLTTLAP